jgi:N-carbamoylputrescine amidase
MSRSVATARRRSRHQLRLGLVQTRASHDVDRNLATAGRLIGVAAGRGARIVCLPELFAGRYFAQVEDQDFLDLAEPVPGRISRFLADCAKRSRVTLVGGSLYELARDGKRYNTTLIFGPDGAVLGKYRKMHIPHDPKYYEQYYFTPGNLGYVQVPVGGAVVAPLICYDQWFPEAARINAIRGAEVIFYPTAIGWFDELKRDEPFSAQRWEDAMRSHASMNGIYVAAVNRVGREGHLRFWGGSFIADPFGEVVARASRTKEEALVADIDLRRIRESQEGWGFLRNRRPASYRTLTR